MHLLVTDHLICPRCGPGFGLILIADRLESRRVMAGALGCPNCRERYPVENGFGDLRPSPRPTEGPTVPDLSDDPEGALRLAAFLGVREGPGFLLLTGNAVRHAARIAAMIERIEVVAIHPGLRAQPESEGVSRMTIATDLPFASHSLRGVVLDGLSGRERMGEALRALAPGSRLVFLSPPSDIGRELEARGVELLLEAESVVVGALK